MKKTSHIIQQLKKMKYRLTTCRKAMVSIFEGSRIPLSASDIQQILRQSGIAVNKTTVYRELDLLKRLDFVKEIEFGEGKKRFENATRNHHHHFVCRNCDMVADIEVDEQSEKNLVKSKKFKILEHTIEFFGLCRECQFAKINV